MISNRTRALLASTAIQLAAASLTLVTAVGATDAAAQSTPIPPEHFTLDPRGVDLVSGSFVRSSGGGTSIGSGATGLSYGRILLENGTWSDFAMGGVWSCGLGVDCVVTIEGITEVFSPTGTLVFAPKADTGSTLTFNWSTNEFTYTRGDGTVFRMAPRNVAGFADGSVIEKKEPNGLVTSYAYFTQTETECTEPDPELEYPGGPPGPTCLDLTSGRLQSYSTNTGYMVHYEYGSSTSPSSPGWSDVSKVTALNLAVDYCAPLATSCTFTRNWPSVTHQTDLGSYPLIYDVDTDQASRQTVYRRDTGGRVYAIRYPGSSVDDVTVTYTSTGSTVHVDTVTDGSGTWTYTLSDSGTTRTVVASGPLDQQTTVVTDLTVGRPSSVSVVTATGLSSTWTYLYDSDGRPTRMTNPEGDYTQLTYDARGNVTETRSVAKPGSGFADIVTTAVYPTSCTNPVTCNLPFQTIDARGYATDYTWDATHGGLLSATALASSASPPGAETRISYAAQTAYYKNSSGVIAAAPSSVILPVQASACTAGSTCSGTANEVRTTLAYGSTGVANNLNPTTVSRGSGLDPAMAVTTMTYTANGDIATIDGPLAGTADTTRVIYDDLRRTVGVIGPDPDGAGTRPNLAQRTNYDSRGLVTQTQSGTTVGQSDTAWASFSPAITVNAAYDAQGRQVRVEQAGAGSTPVAQQQWSYDAAGRVLCATVRMTPSATPVSDACTATTGTSVPDRITQFAYDVAGRPTHVTSGFGLPGSITEVTTYTPNGQVASLTDGNGNVSIIEYDGHDRASKLRYPDPTTAGVTSSTDYELVEHDFASGQIRIRNRAGQYTTITYDRYGQPTLIDAPAGTMDVALSYDLLGRTTSVAGNGQTITRTYDALSRMTAESGSLGTMGYQYDTAGRTTRITWPDAFYAQYDYDVSGALTAIRENGATSGSGVLANYTYTNVGQPNTIARGNGIVTTYGYDSAGRMTSLAHSGSSAVTFGYGYNAAGQISSRTVSNPAYVLAPGPGTTAYVSDGLNRATSAGGVSIAYDLNQNIATALGASYQYDAANRLTSATIGGTGYNFSYDPAGRLYGSSGGRFIYAGQQLVGEYNSSGGLDARHIPGPGLDMPVASLFSNGLRVQQIADERGSVIAVVDAGGAFNINRYDEYGIASAANRFQYTGQAYLAPGLYYYRARVYAPQFGRFLQADPLGYSAGLNVYGYVGADPINWTDRFGLDQDPNCTPDDPRVSCPIVVTGRRDPCAAIGMVALEMGVCGHSRPTFRREPYPWEVIGDGTTVGPLPAGHVSCFTGNYGDQIPVPGNRGTISTSRNSAGQLNGEQAGGRGYWTSQSRDRTGAFRSGYAPSRSPGAQGFNSTRGSGRGGVPLPETVVVVVFESYDHSYADRRQHIGGYAHTQTYSLPRGVWTARVGDNRDGENRRASVTICGEPF